MKPFTQKLIIIIVLAIIGLLVTCSTPTCNRNVGQAAPPIAGCDGDINKWTKCFTTYLGHTDYVSVSIATWGATIPLHAHIWKMVCNEQCNFTSTDITIYPNRCVRINWSGLCGAGMWGVRQVCVENLDGNDTPFGVKVVWANPCTTPCYCE
jgi:hypothetical protein